MSGKNIVVLGVGNILLSDEGVGVHLVNQLTAEYEFSNNVIFVDGAALSFKLMPLIKQADYLIIIDALEANDDPGSVYQFELSDVKMQSKNIKTSLHQTSLTEVIDMVRMTDKLPQKTVIIGIQPADINTPNIGCTEKIVQKFPLIKDLVLKELESLGITYKKRKAKLRINI